MSRFYKYAFSLLCLCIISGGLVYYIYRLNTAGIFFLLALALAIFSIIKKFRLLDDSDDIIQQSGEIVTRPEKKKNGLIFQILALAACFVSFAFCIFFLFHVRTDQAMVSPWTRINPAFFICAFILNSCFLLLLSNLRLGTRNSKLLIFAHSFFYFSIFLIVYKIGYGFDPFIHSASMDYILKHGSIEPKTLLYSGYYGLLVPLAKIFSITPFSLDRITVPLLGALILPAVFFRFFKSFTADLWMPSILTAIILIFPFSFLTFSTPQNLSYIFFLAAIFTGIACRSRTDRTIVWLSALASFFIHPLSGIPALLFAVHINAGSLSRSPLMKKIIRSGALISAVVLLPASFLVQAGADFFSSNFRSALELFSGLNPTMAGSENIFLNTAYFFGSNFWLLFILLVLAGIALFKNSARMAGSPALFSAALFVSALLTASLPFDMLIGYERLDYAKRMLFLSFLFSLPYAFLTVRFFAEKIIRSEKPVRLIFAVATAIALTASLYLSYPRKDNYFNSRGYSTSAANIDAVKWIDEDAGAGDYVVLANQQVSAATLKEFGFKKYYEGKNISQPYPKHGTEAIFYYPIPTGGKLYNLYLDMVYKHPDRKTVGKAFEMTGAQIGYFAIDKYWWAYKKIADEAILSADSYKSFNDGEVMVFKYVK
jgi:hypothetical protein